MSRVYALPMLKTGTERPAPETSAPRTVHLGDRCGGPGCGPVERSLCGRDLRDKPQVAADDEQWGDPTKCVVCREINRNLVACPVCGKRLPGR